MSSPLAATFRSEQIPEPADTSTADFNETYSAYEPPVNDSERAVRFANRCREILQYVPEWGFWLKWDGTRWVRDVGDVAVYREAQQIPKLLLAEAVLIDDLDRRKRAFNAANRAGDKARLDAMIALASKQDGMAVTAKSLDADPFLLGVTNGVLDLRTGKFRETRREDFITKQAGTHYDPDAQCPVWTKFLHRVFDGNEELIQFIQRAVGYSLTGCTSEHALFFLYGGGRNGKTTFTDTIQSLLKEYAHRAPSSLFTQDRSGREPEKEIAELVGTRFVVGSEIEEGSRLAESRVKDLTGQDRLTGRRIYMSSFEFIPSHKLWIFGNHKPEIRGTDMGIWRRMRLVPFSVEIPEEEVDRNLLNKLLAELPGILNWAVQGCVDWQASGLCVPTSVKQATGDYREEEDDFGEFLESVCESSGEVERGALFLAYTLWARARSLRFIPSPKTFAKRLRERGIQERKSGCGRFWLGLSLREFPAEVGISP